MTYNKVNRKHLNTVTAHYIFDIHSHVSKHVDIAYEQYQHQIQAQIFWVVTPCGDVVGYQRFGGPCCIHAHGEVGRT